MMKIDSFCQPSLKGGASGRRVRFKHKQSIADPWAPIDAFLQGLQLYRSHVPGDGSCQFHAISTQSRFNHIELRRQALAYIRSHASEFADFITGDSMESYLSHMARRHTWGDHITLRALAMCLNQPIHVANRHGVTVVPTDAAHVDASPIWVAYNGVHYDAALPVQIQPALVAPHVPAEPLHHSRPSANCNFAQAPPSCPGLPLDSSASASPSVSPFGASGRTFPRPLPFAIASCNITSLKKNASLLEGFPDVIALQETRHTSLSPGALLSKLRLLGYSAIFGSPVVQRAPSRTGQARTIFNGRPGGVALAFKSHVPAQIVPVGKCELRQRLWQTGRWLHCVIGYGSSGRAIHVIVVYGYTGTYSHSTKSHSQNESFLSDVFLESSRRLDVPCIVLGDFNRQPQDSHACHQACVQGDWLDAAVAACRLDPTHFPANGLCRRLDAIFLSKVAAVTFHAYSVLDDTGIPSHRPVLVRLTLPAVHNVHTQLKRPRRFPPEALVPTPDTDQPFFQSCFASFAPIWESHLQSNNTTGMFLTLSSLAEAFLCSKANLQVNKRNCTLYCGRGTNPHFYWQPAAAVSRPAKAGGDQTTVKERCCRKLCKQLEEISRSIPAELGSWPQRLAHLWQLTQKRALSLDLSFSLDSLQSCRDEAMKLADRLSTERDYEALKWIFTPTKGKPLSGLRGPIGAPKCSSSMVTPSRPALRRLMPLCVMFGFLSFSVVPMSLSLPGTPFWTVTVLQFRFYPHSP